MANPFDNRPLHERLDLNYVRRRTWPKRHYQAATVLLCLPVVAWLVVLSVRGDQRIYSAGELTHAHAAFAHDCAQCHQPDTGRSGYWLPVSDAACLSCHAAEAHHPMAAVHGGIDMRVADRLGAIAMATRCADCHVEHRGRSHDLLRVPDAVCIQCHGNLDAYRNAITSMPFEAAPPDSPAGAAAPAEAAP
jgi:predicted CXXCH cytochrome family protein